MPHLITISQDIKNNTAHVRMNGVHIGDVLSEDGNTAIDVKEILVNIFVLLKIEATVEFVE